MTYVPQKSPFDTPAALRSYLEREFHAIARSIPAVATRATFYVSDYGAIGDGTTDDTVALQAVADAVNEAGSGEVIFEPGKNYKIWVASSPYLFDLDGCDGVIVRGNGATLTSGRVNGPGTFAFRLTDCKRTLVENLKLMGSNTALSPSTGEGLVLLFENCKQTALVNLESENCQSFLAVGTQVYPLTDRSEGIIVLNPRIISTYYGLNFAGDGDGVFAHGVIGRNTGRVYFPYNCQNHDVSIVGEQGGPFTDCLLKCYGTDSGFTKLRNIRLVYSTDGRYSGSGDEHTATDVCTLEAQLSAAVGLGGGPAHFENIDVTLNVVCSTPDQLASIFAIRKYTESGTRDTSDRGHTFNNIRIGGIVREAQNLINAAAIDLFTTEGGTTWNGTSDFAYNISVERFRLEGTGTKDAIAVSDGRALQDNFSLRDVHTTEDITLTGIPSTCSVDYRNVTAANFDPPGAFDLNGTAGNTRFLVYDVDNGTLERVSVGAADSGGLGFKVLRIPN